MTNPGSINAQGGNPGGPAAPLPAGSVPLNQPPTPTPPSTSADTDPQSASTTMPVNSLVQPGPLKTFIYSPQVRIVIAHNDTEYDVSADIVRCSLVRPENSAATLFFTLHNKGLRYTPPGGKPFFYRMDRVVVYMKKTSWTQVFAGYLDKVPYKQLYAGEVNFRATCTVKRLMHTWWDPALPASQSLLNQMNGLLGPDGIPSTDSGLGAMLQKLLVDVGGWNVANIHIQNFPTSFLQFLMTQIAQLQTSNAPNLLQFQQMLVGSDTTPGPGAYAGANANAGPPGPSVPAAGAGGMTFYLSQIVSACDQRGMGPQPIDNNVAAGLIQAGTTGEASGGGLGSNDQKAWQQVYSTGMQYQQSTRNSDGAILGVAAAMVASGGGTTIRNLYNPAVPGSESCPNDGPGVANGTACGIFGQTDQGWGTVVQRMNPMQAAGMFFSALNNVSGWRNMDPGQAIQMAQQTNNASVAAFDAAVTLATTLVQAYRTSGATAISSVLPSGTVTGSSVAGQTLTSAGAPSATPAALAGAASTFPSPTSAASAVNPLSQNKPVPDSEGAINFARTCLGLPYLWGGTGPAGYDCSGLVQAAFKSIGVAIPRTTWQIAAQVRQIPTSQVQRGDIVEPSSGHVVLWMGDGTIIEAQQTGVPIHQITNPYPMSNWYGVYRACANGGPDPSAAFNPPSIMGPGTPPAALSQVGGATQTGSGGATEPVARNLWSYIFQPGAFSSDTAGLFTGVKAFIEGQPLINMVQAIAGASLRCWSSAPNGDLMFWYPDYWGFDGKPAVMLLADIEMKDCTIELCDDALTTHVYINGDLSMSGTMSDPTSGWIMTAGVATVEQPWLYARLLVASPGDIEVAAGQQIMQRFGIRPLQQAYAMAGTQELEFLLACQVFMEQWAKQFQTVIQMTFMPELFPGMRVELPDRDLQVYVSRVAHTCDYEQGFFTQVTISAPSSPQAASMLGTVKTPVTTVQSQALTSAANKTTTAGSGPT